MINTVSIKSAQLVDGFFTTGTGEEKILVMGSCRVAPYMNYFQKWNEQNGNRFTIYSLDPFNFNWSINDERCDYEEALLKWETNEGLLNMLASVDIFLHEHYQNSGMFNVKQGDAKTIYKFGVKPKKDVCLPNFNDCFILCRDIATFDTKIRKEIEQDINVIGKVSSNTLLGMKYLSQKGLQKFYDVCLLSDIPEMKHIVGDNFKKKRFWHSYNHVSKNFTMAIFNILCERYLKINLPNDFYDDQEDIFANSFTPLTQYDVDFYGYEWSEELKPLL